MKINENYRRVPVRFYEDGYGTIYYESAFTHGVAPSIKDAFAEFSREDFARDFVYYLDDVVDVKVGTFKPALKDQKLKGMKYIGSLDIEAEVGKQFRNSINSLTHLSKNKNDVERHVRWVADMKQKAALTEMFDPIKTNRDLICEHCGEIIPSATYYEEYRGKAYHLECIWDKLINKKNSNSYDNAIEYFLSLQKYLGQWPAYGLDVEDDYKHDLELVKHNNRINKKNENLKETY